MCHDVIKRCLMGAVLLCGSSGVASASLGHFTLDGVKQDFTEVSAFRIRDRNNVQEFNTLVLLTNEVPNREAIAEAEDPYALAINDPATADNYMSLVVKPDGVVQINASFGGVQYIDSSGQIFGEKGSLSADCSENSDKRVNCKVSTAKPVNTPSGSIWTMDVDFESDVLAKAPGKPLENKGAAQMSALAALDKARGGDDLETILSLHIEAEANQYRDDWSTPEEHLSSVKQRLESMLPTSLEFMEGEYRGDTEATLLVRGMIEAWGDTELIFRITMHLENDQWLFERGDFVGMAD